MIALQERAAACIKSKEGPKFTLVFYTLHRQTPLVSWRYVYYTFIYLCHWLQLQVVDYEARGRM